MEKENKGQGNPFIEAVKGFAGKEVEVVLFSNGKESIEKGRVLVIDYIYRSVIIENAEGQTILIPRYLKLIML